MVQEKKLVSSELPEVKEYLENIFKNATNNDKLYYYNNDIIGEYDKDLNIFYYNCYLFFHLNDINIDYGKINLSIKLLVMKNFRINSKIEVYYDIKNKWKKLGYPECNNAFLKNCGRNG